MKKPWENYLRQWKELLNRQTYHATRRSRAAMGRCGEVQLLEARLVLAADLNDQIVEAISLGGITSETTQTGTIGTTVDDAGDVNLYRFTVSAGQRISFDVDHVTGSFNSALRLFNSSGAQLVLNDNAAAPGETVGTEAYLSYTFTTAGTYYLGVGGSANTGYNILTGAGDRAASTGDYSLTVTWIDTDDQLSEAAALGALLSDLSRASTVELQRDVDVYRFTATAGQLVSLDVDRSTGSTLNSFLRLFSADGTEVGSNDNAAAPDETVGSDSYLQYQVTTSGDYFVAVSSTGNSGFNISDGSGDQAGTTTGAYTLRVLYVDPNDQISEAASVGAIANDVSVTGTLSTTTDVNFYSVTVTAGQRLGFDIDHTGVGLNSLLRVFNSAGTQLVVNDNAAAPGETLGQEAYLAYTFATAGTYYIGVSNSVNVAYVATTGLGDRAGTTGAYSLTISPLDIDDQISEAGVIGQVLGTTIRSSAIDIPYDVDVYSVAALAGQTLTFDLDLVTGSTLDSYVRLFDSAGSSLAVNDDGAAPGESSGPESFLSFDVTSSGTYYIAVSAAGNTSYSVSAGTGDAGATTSGRYSLSVSYNDTNDSIAEASSQGNIVGAASVSGTIGSAADVNLYAISVLAGQQIGFDVDHTSVGFNSFLRVFSSNGAQVASNDNAAAPGESLGQEAYLRYTFQTAGTYYVGLSSSANTTYVATTGLGDRVGSMGDYNLVMTPFDSDDQLSEAATLALTGTSVAQSSNLENALDVDVFRVSAIAGQRLGVDIDRLTGSTLDSYLRVYDAAGNAVASNDNEAGPGEAAGTEAYIEFDVSSSGFFYFVVSAVGNINYDVSNGTGDSLAASSGTYSITVTSVDGDDQLAEAASLGAATTTLSASGTINIATDVDLVKFTVSAGQRLEFDVDNANGSTVNSFLRIFDASGQQIAMNDNAAATGETLGTEAFLAQTFATSGTYYAGISNTGNRSYVATTGAGDTSSSTAATGDYSLTISLVDADDQISEAFNLGTIATFMKRDASIESSRDVDMYRFTVTAGKKLGFDVDNATGSSLDSFIQVFDASGNVLASNDNGTGTGESSSNDSYVEYTFSTAGTYYVAVSSKDNQGYNPTTGTGDTAGTTGGYSLTATVIPNSLGFQIDLTFNGLTPSQQAIFQQAAARWSEIIIGDLPDVTYQGQVIDDVRISATATAIDGVNGILGSAGPTGFRGGSALPYLGQMNFDTADLSNLEASGRLVDVIIHEMGHVLGIGTLWSHLGLLSGGGTSNPLFTGAQATAAYNRIFSTNAAGVPVENSGGAGTRDAHWRESVMPYEIMTGYLSQRNKITEITVGSLADMGYSVNIGAADLYPF